MTVDERHGAGRGSERGDDPSPPEREGGAAERSDVAGRAGAAGPADAGWADAPERDGPERDAAAVDASPIRGERFHDELAAGSAPAAEPAEDDEDEEPGGPALLRAPRRLAWGLLAVVLAIVAIYVLLPMIVGLQDALDRMARATWYWIVAGVAFTVASFGAYVALFRGILGGREDDALHRRLDVAASYQITMAGLAATRLFSAAGAGGIALTYWALRKAGMRPAVAACRMVAFLALLYGMYLFALVLFGLLLRTGVLPGANPFGATVVPAALAAVGLMGFLLVALIPGDVERRLRGMVGHPRLGRLAARVASGPATVARGVRTAIAYLRHPRRGALALGGAAGFWAAQVAILWASFEAFGGDVPFAVLVQGFFLGMAANLIPSPAAGAGPVDAGMIGAFLLFGQPAGLVFPAVLTFRVLAFWLPLPPGVVAYFQLRRTVQAWEDAGPRSPSRTTVPAEAL